MPPFVPPGSGKGKSRALADGEMDVEMDSESGPVPVPVEETCEAQLEDKRERFRKVWLGKVVQAFGSELDQMRKVGRLFLRCVCAC